MPARVHARLTFAETGTVRDQSQGPRLVPRQAVRGRGAKRWQDSRRVLREEAQLDLRRESRARAPRRRVTHATWGCCHERRRAGTARRGASCPDV
eukprot:354157-Chlamydomonas_euryale.AAC.8